MFKALTAVHGNIILSAGCWIIYILLRHGWKKAFKLVWVFVWEFVYLCTDLCVFSCWVCSMYVTFNVYVCLCTCACVCVSLTTPVLCHLKHVGCSGIHFTGILHLMVPPVTHTWNYDAFFKIEKNTQRCKLSHYDFIMWVFETSQLCVSSWRTSLWGYTHPAADTL